ncbi:MAG: hypothetical protein E7301_11620 [Butyrivibrio sp.]|nr:hypothetical protein [Butyrivibrio sp.]
MRKVKVLSKVLGLSLAFAVCTVVPGGVAQATTGGDGLYSTMSQIYGTGSTTSSSGTSTQSTTSDGYSSSDYLPDISSGSSGSSNGGSEINGRPTINYYPIGHYNTTITPQQQTGSASGYPTGSASMNVDGDSYTVRISDGQIFLTTDDNTYAKAMPSQGSVYFETNYEDVSVTINGSSFTVNIDGETTSGTLATTTLVNNQMASGVSVSQGAQTFVQDIGPLESDPIGPHIEAIKLSESYHENYQVYEERMDDIYAIYTNIPNGTITNKPVIFDVPSGVVVRLTKDGKDCSFRNKERISEEGTYVMYLYVAQDNIEQIPAWAQSMDRAMFNFRIQYTALDGSTLGATQQSELESFADVANEEVQETPVEEPVEEPEEEPAEESATPEPEPETETTKPVEENFTIDLTNVFTTEYDSSTGYYKSTLLTGNSFYSNIPNGMVTNGSVMFSTADEIRYELYKDGEAVEYNAGDYISENGNYTMIPVIDNLDYEGFYRSTRPMYRFRILNGSTSDMASLSAPDLMTITSIRYEDEDVTKTNLITENVAVLPLDGAYEVDLNGPDGSTTLTVIRDTQAPKVNVEVKPNLAKITYQSEDISAATLYRGTEVVLENALPTSVTEAGRYRLVTSDKAGNTTTTDFAVQYRINIYAILAIVMIIGLIGAVVIFIRRSKTKVRVR